MPTLELYRFRYRDGLTRKPCMTRYLLSDADAQKRFGNRLIGRVEGTQEIRDVDDLTSHSAAHVQSSPK